MTFKDPLADLKLLASDSEWLVQENQELRDRLSAALKRLKQMKEDAQHLKWDLDALHTLLDVRKTEHKKPPE